MLKGVATLDKSLLSVLEPKLTHRKGSENHAESVLRVRARTFCRLHPLYLNLASVGDSLLAHCVCVQVYLYKGDWGVLAQALDSRLYQRAYP